MQPLPGFPMTSSISPGLIVPENPRRIGLEESFVKFRSGLSIPKADLAADETVGAACD